MKEELISSAVGFLKDPNVSGSPLTKKVEFLESKGLNQQEIEEALRRANDGGNGGVDKHTVPRHTGVSAVAPPIDYYNVAPEIPERNWKDYFIMATATAGVAYGLYQVASRYLLPSLIPPSQKSIEDDKARIDEEFAKIDKVLEQLSKEQEEVNVSNQEKQKELEVVIENINDFLSKYNKDKLKFDDDLKLMKLEVDNLKNNIEKNMVISKDNIHDELQDIGEELVSLKNLMKIRAEKSSGESASSRKLPPVSSIPSASEVLKRAKEKAGNTSDRNSGSDASANVSPEPVKVGITPSVTENGISAAGIPEWQMKHKEEQIGASKNDDVVNESINKIGVPAWQLNTANKNTTDDSSKGDTPDHGIPEWQKTAS